MVVNQTDLDAFLLTLGNTKEEIAENLQKRGITGYRKSTISCPLAKALESQFGDEFSVTPYGLKHKYAEVRQRGINTRLDAGKTIQDFIVAFDNGLFTNLMKLTI